METLLAAFWSFVPMLITTMSAAGCLQKFQGSGLSGRVNGWEFLVGGVR